MTRATTAAATTVQVYNALIRTHHITSRKKIAALRKAAAAATARLSSSSDDDGARGSLFVLIRSGGSPGIMYVEGAAEGAVRAWVARVESLRYKDYQCVHRPAPASAQVNSVVEVEVGVEVDVTSNDAVAPPSPPPPPPPARTHRTPTSSPAVTTSGFVEVTTVAAFAEQMERRGLERWWKVGMGWG